MSEEIKNDDVEIAVEAELTATEELAADLGIEAIIEEVKEDDKQAEGVISAPEPVESVKKVPAIAPVADGVIGSASASVTKANKKPKAVEAKEVEKVAVYSSKNVTWTGVGKVYVGFNIVTKEQADKWLTRNHTRLATPEEVAKEFGAL
jgi:DNA-binding protein H-NS